MNLLSHRLCSLFIDIFTYKNVSNVLDKGTDVVKVRQIAVACSFCLSVTEVRS